MGYLQRLYLLECMRKYYSRFFEGLRRWQGMDHVLAVVDRIEHSGERCPVVVVVVVVVVAYLEEACGPSDWAGNSEVEIDPFDWVECSEEGIDLEEGSVVVESPSQFVEGLLEKYLCSLPWTYLVADEWPHQRPHRSYDHLKLLAHLGQLNLGW